MNKVKILLEHLRDMVVHALGPEFHDGVVQVLVGPARRTCAVLMPEDAHLENYIKNKASKVRFAICIHARRESELKRLRADLKEGLHLKIAYRKGNRAARVRCLDDGFIVQHETGCRAVSRWVLAKGTFKKKKPQPATAPKATPATAIAAPSVPPPAPDAATAPQAGPQP